VLRLSLFVAILPSCESQDISHEVNNKWGVVLPPIAWDPCTLFYCSTTTWLLCVHACELATDACVYSDPASLLLSQRVSTSVDSNPTVCLWKRILWWLGWGMRLSGLHMPIILIVESNSVYKCGFKPDSLPVIGWNSNTASWGYTVVLISGCIVYSCHGNGSHLGVQNELSLWGQDGCRKNATTP
jgi:hypothetical protein